MLAIVKLYHIKHAVSKEMLYELKFKLHKIFAIDFKGFSINCLHL